MHCFSPGHAGPQNDRLVLYPSVEYGKQVIIACDASSHGGLARIRDLQVDRRITRSVWHRRRIDCRHHLFQYCTASRMDGDSCCQGSSHVVLCSHGLLFLLLDRYRRTRVVHPVRHVLHQPVQPVYELVPRIRRTRLHEPSMGLDRGEVESLIRVGFEVTAQSGVRKDEYMCVRDEYLSRRGMAIIPQQIR